MTKLTHSGPLPRLHLVTNDQVLRSPGFLGAARTIMAKGGPGVGLHLRGHGLSGAELYRIGSGLSSARAEGGALGLVNDRIDLALALGLDGIHLGRRSIPVAAARALLGPEYLIGYSAHDLDEVGRAEEDGADYIVFGTIFPSASHPGGETAGLEGLARAVERTDLPVIAIGGVTPERVRAVLQTGAHGIAVLGGVWNARRPFDAVVDFLTFIEEE